MKLNLEIAPTLRPNRWVWRVRSTETKHGEACLAVGMSRISEEDAQRIGRAVQKALEPVFRTAGDPPA